MCNKPWFLGTVCMMLALCSLPARADEIPPMPPAPKSLLVGDMLRIDADRARAAELAKTASAPGIVIPVLSTNALVVPGLPSAHEPVAPPVSLSSIYGVGRQLYANVRIHGHTVTYAAGRAQPIRTSQPDTMYHLRAIRPPCVRLQARSAGVAFAAPMLELCLGGKP